MKTKDDILLESAYQKILERYMDTEDDQESLFNRYQQEFNEFLQSQRKTVGSNGGLDYNTDESGEMVLYIPQISFSSDVNIDRDLDINSQVDRVRNTIINFIDKNPELKNIIDVEDINVGHSIDKGVEEITDATENEWIGVTIYIKQDIEVNEDRFPYFLKMIKFINDFLLNLTTFPQFKRL